MMLVSALAVLSLFVSVTHARVLALPRESRPTVPRKRVDSSHSSGSGRVASAACSSSAAPGVGVRGLLPSAFGFSRVEENIRKTLFVHLVWLLQSPEFGRWRDDLAVEVVGSSARGEAALWPGAALDVRLSGRGLAGLADKKDQGAAALEVRPPPIFSSAPARSDGTGGTTDDHTPGRRARSVSSESCDRAAPESPAKGASLISACSADANVAAGVHATDFGDDSLAGHLVSMLERASRNAIVAKAMAGNRVDITAPSSVDSFGALSEAFARFLTQSALALDLRPGRDTSDHRDGTSAAGAGGRGNFGAREQGYHMNAQQPPSRGAAAARGRMPVQVFETEQDRRAWHYLRSSKSSDFVEVVAEFQAEPNMWQRQTASHRTSGKGEVWSKLFG
ncbi:unnamed protein product, partial [Amoebophrya sp. A25]|eukprot:GSA25T00005134001.1